MRCYAYSWWKVKQTVKFIIQSFRKKISLQNYRFVCHPYTDAVKTARENKIETQNTKSKKENNKPLRGKVEE